LSDKSGGTDKSGADTGSSSHAHHEGSGSLKNTLSAIGNFNLFDDGKQKASGRGSGKRGGGSR
jgi:hypothetical protein